MQLTRLTYVYDEEPGALGRLVEQLRGTLRFGEGSGIIHVSDAAALRAGVLPTPEVSVRFSVMSYYELTPDVLEVVRNDDLPCVLGHTESETVILLPPRSIARWNGGLNDLRGKIRFALAKHAWTL